MQRIDLISFETLLQELAECYSQRPYSASAIKHWFEALSDFHWDKVRHQLMLWRDSKPKPPMISEILHTLRDHFSDDLERKAIEDKKAFARAPTPATAYGEACMVKVREMLAHPRKPGKWWAYELRDLHRAGKSLNFAQLEAAKQVCGADWNNNEPPREENTHNPAVVDRVPGEDDE